MGTDTSGQTILEEIFSHTSDCIFLLDGNRRIVFYNDAGERLTGFSQEEIATLKAECSQLNEWRDEKERMLLETMYSANGILQGDRLTAQQRKRIINKNGEKRWVEAVYTRIAGNGQQGECILGLLRDITVRVEREEQWRESTENLQEEMVRLREDTQAKYGFTDIVSRSPSMAEALEKTRSACFTSSPVLICGEKGTGKEIVARTIHVNGLQKEGPFVPFCCADTASELLESELFGRAEPGHERYPGMFVAADKGTLFLENVDRLSVNIQGKLLRAIQDHNVCPVGSTERIPANPRIIATVNMPAQRFFMSPVLREDLLSRLGVLALELPSLRDRKEDIPLLVYQFIYQLNEQSTRQVEHVDPSVWVILEAHDWPGNVRELQNVIESAYVSGSGSTLRAEEIRLGAAVKGRGNNGGVGVLPLDDVLADVERRSILGALRKAGGQRSLSAKLLHISRSRLYRRMDVLGISAREKHV